METASRRGTATVIVLILIAGRAPADAPGPKAIAERIVQAGGVKAGIAVQVGVTDGRLAAALARAGRFYLDGLASDEASLPAARTRLRAERLAHRVGLRRGTFDRLPYAEDLINLLVVTDLSRAVAAGLRAEEIRRVLAPSGVAVMADPKAASADALRKIVTGAGLAEARILSLDGPWAIVRKPRPEAMDDWTHSRYDAGGNAVSADTAVGPPRRLRWITRPAWPRSHPGGPAAVRCAGGRFFCVYDEAVPFSPGPSKTSLIARDAFNGSLLWRRPLDLSYRRGETRREARFNDRCFIATADRLYAVLRPAGPLVELDAATGRTLRTYEKAGTPGRAALHAGTLLLTGGGPLRRLDPATGEILWEADGGDGPFVADGEQVLTLTRTPGYTLSRFDLATGRRQWQVATAPHAPKDRRALVLCFLSGGIVVVGEGYGGRRNGAFAAKDGRFLWEHEYRPAGACQDAFHIDGLVWLNAGGRDPELRGLDPTTGAVKRKIPYLAGVSRGHHRCHLNKATRRYVLSGVKDFECIRVADGDFFNVRSLRGSCADGGVLPANGLVYAFPHPCTCLRPLRGFSATGPGPADATPTYRPLLQRGPAAGRPLPAVARQVANEWPTYRADFRRSAATTTAVSAKLSPRWTRQLLAPLTAPTVAGGRVFVASIDSHEVIALDAGTGARRWSFAAEGRVDTPPTATRGMVLFGSMDGWVYCLDASDGALRWRLRAAPEDRLIAADGQLESAWPVHGSVLLVKGTAFFAAGRHTHLDGGIHLFAVEPETGEVLWRKRAGGESPADILISDGRLAYMFEAGYAPADGEKGYHWRALRLRVSKRTQGALEKEWTRRGYSIQSDDRDAAGELVAFTPAAAFAVNAFPNARSRDAKIELGGDGWKLLAVSYNRPERGAAKATPRWDQLVGVRMRSMVLAGETLLVAGVSDADPTAARLLAFAAADGRKLGAWPLAADAVDEGLAVAYGRLFLSMKDGTVRCFGAAGSGSSP